MSTTTTTTKKKLSDEAYLIIRNDIPLREKLAKELRIQVHSVYASAVRTSPRFSEKHLLKIIIRHTGKSEKEILKQN